MQNPLGCCKSDTIVASASKPGNSTTAKTDDDPPDMTTKSIISRTKNNESSQLFLLPDETLVEIVQWLPSAKDCVLWSRTCQRLHRIIQQDKAVVTKLVESRKIPLPISTFEQLAWYERIKEFGLLKENRIGFSVASPEIDDNHEESNDEENDEDANDDDNDMAQGNTVVHGSMKRIAHVQQLMQEFPRMTVTVDAHCGTGGPLVIAGRLSQHRGMMVVDELTKEPDGAAASRNSPSSWWRRNNSNNNNSNNNNDSYPPINTRELTNRVTLHAWGRRISDHAAAMGASSHPYAILAQYGKGWVEIYFQLDGMELPHCPDFYQGFSPDDHQVDLSQDDLFDDQQYRPVIVRHVIRFRPS